jgi:hypothetical protein
MRDVKKAGGKTGVAGFLQGVNSIFLDTAPLILVLADMGVKQSIVDYDIKYRVGASDKEDDDGG